MGDHFLAGLVTILEVHPIDFPKDLPLDWDIIFGHGGVHWAHLDARVTVDALGGIDVELGALLEVLLAGGGVDAVDRAHVGTSGVLGADARLGDDVGYGSFLWR